MELDLEAKEQFEQKFRVITLLGKGSFGCVYECEDRADNQVYAVKVISKNDVKRSKIDCLREEAKILSTIQHPNIVKVHEFGETNTFIYLKMEAVRSGTLEKLIRKRWESGRKFTDDEAAQIMGAIFRGVSHIHSVSIIHRDIKPDNILLPTENGLSDLKIADFGLSTRLDFHYPKTASSKCGTMLYMAPEVLCNFTYTKSVDVWSCAIIMYMLLHGKHPLHEPKMSNQDYKRKIKNIKFAPLADNMAQDFFNRISKVEANERYTTQEALKHPWLTRNFDDQIPLSLHESFSGFEKSHYISQIMKTLIGVRQLVKPNQDLKVPESYIKKKDFFIKQTYSGLTKSKSKQSARQLNTISGMSCVMKEAGLEKSPRKKSVVEVENPTILKLNSIFNSLFGKRSKQPMKTYTEGMIVRDSAPKENTVQLADISTFKQKIEAQIQRAVEELCNNCRASHKRILPSKQSQASSEHYLPAKEEIKGDSKASAPYKIRFRKKHTHNLKLYE